MDNASLARAHEYPQCPQCKLYVNTRFWPDHKPGDTCNSCVTANFLAKIGVR